MTDAATLAPPPVPAPADGDAGRAIRPRRALPGGRAVVGAFLVVLAAVGTFGAYLQATAAPSTEFMVAARGFEIGHVLVEGDLVGSGAGFRAVAMDLPEDQAARAFGVGDASALLGRVVVAPIEPGDLLQRSSVADVEGSPTGVALSFSLPFDRALAGRVAAGEQVDVIATFVAAGRQGSTTRLVARGVTIVAATAAGEGLSGGRVTLTVEVPDLRTAQELQHAVDTAEVAILRGSDPGASTPGAITGSSAPATDGSAPDQPADESSDPAAEGA